MIHPADSVSPFRKCPNRDRLFCGMTTQITFTHAEVPYPFAHAMQEVLYGPVQPLHAESHAPQMASDEIPQGSATYSDAEHSVQSAAT